MAKLGDICTNQSSNIKQSDLENNNGSYPIYGASGLIKNVDFYKQEKPYVAVVKDGKTVGYVANNPYTLIDEVKSASNIRNQISDEQKIEILFIYLGEYVIARLLD